MDLGAIQIGVDVATSVSIVGASLLFIHQSQRERRQRYSEGIDETIKSSLAKEIGELMQQVQPVWRNAHSLYGSLTSPASFEKSGNIIDMVREFTNHVQNFKNILVSFTFTLCPIFEAADDKVALDVYDRLLLKLSDSTECLMHHTDNIYIDNEHLAGTSEGNSISKEVRDAIEDAMNAANNALKSISGMLYQVISRNPKGGMAQALMRYTD